MSVFTKTNGRIFIVPKIRSFSDFHFILLCYNRLYIGAVHEDAASEALCHRKASRRVLRRAVIARTVPEMKNREKTDAVYGFIQAGQEGTVSDCTPSAIRRFLFPDGDKGLVFDFLAFFRPISTSTFQTI